MRPETGAAQDSLAALRQLLKNQQNAAAESRARQWLVELEATAGTDTLRGAALDLLVESLKAGGKWGDPDSRKLAERAAELKESLYGPDHTELAKSLYNLAWLLYRAGEWDLARPAAERALAIQERAHGPKHAGVVRSLHILANVLEDAADFTGAERLYQRELSIGEEIFGAQGVEVANTLNSMAILFRKTGRYSESKPLYERSLAIREKLLGSGHVDVSWSLNNYANLLTDMGDLQAARRMYERALEIREKALEPGHPGVALGLNNLAIVELDLGDTALALQHHERTLAIREKALAPGHPDIAQSLSNLGLLWTATGELARARRALERALAIREGAFGPEHPEVARSLQHLGDLLLSSGEPEDAARSFERALAIRSRAFGPANPDVAASWAGLARARFVMRDDPGAFDAALEAESIASRHLRATARVLEERVAIEYASTRASGIEVALSILAGSPRDSGRVTRAWDAVIRSRALVLDEMAARHRTVASSADRVTIALADSLRRARERLARLVARGPGPGTAARYREQLGSAERDKERVEAALAEHSAAFGRERALSGAGLDEVTAVLPPGSALVAYVRFNRLESAPAKDQGSGRKLAAGIPSYIAFVLGPGIGAPAVAAVWPAEALEDAGSRWLLAASRAPTPVQRARSEAECRSLGESLRALAWDPVAPRVAGARRILVVPDGVLLRVNLSALVAPDGRYLIESAPPFQPLSAERDLIGFEAPRQHRGGLLVLGGTDFDALPAVGGSPAAARPGVRAGADRAGNAGNVPYSGPSSHCEGFLALRFEPLPASGLEADEVARLWAGTVSGRSAGGPNETPWGQRDGSIVRLSGTRASESELKRLAPGRRVLHLATHGFFMGTDCPPPSRHPGVGGAPGSARSAGSIVVENPLLGSGLALAGANRRTARHPGNGIAPDDGILTAEEIASLDLGSVEWAVLSACETGAGAIAASEGVLGLRRAFQVAGAGTVIMSLWAADDASSREWMHALYAARLREGLDTPAAVRAAGLEVLRQRRAQGMSTHPYYWGAFVAAGDWH